MQRHHLQNIKRHLRWFLSYGVILGAAFWFAYTLRFIDADFEGIGKNLNFYQEQRNHALLWVVGLKLFLIWASGHFRGLIVYFRMRDVTQISGALFFATATLITLSFIPDKFLPFDANLPRGVLLIDFNLSLLAIVGFRVFYRVWAERLISREDRGRPQERVAIVGAGSAGAQLAAELLNRRGHGLLPVCFLDDDEDKEDSEIHGIPVVGSPTKVLNLKERFVFTKVILALPTASIRRVREINQICKEAGIATLAVPSLRELATGKVRASDLREVSLEDLLGRTPAQLDDEGINGIVQDKVVLVTGAGGSIGSEIACQVAARRPARLLIVDQCENLLYQIEQDLIFRGFGALITPLVADVTDLPRMAGIFEKYRPQLVLHAAAHKHVPMMESQPGEALKNNALGTELTARLASEYQAERFILISTDKAINPTNAMGASKRLAEIAVQAHQSRPGNQTRFMAVRFGNVLGSSGSVIPLFRKQIAAGGPVTVTHPDVTRYFMTIPEAVGLVLQSATLGQGGEIFVLNMGEPLKIIDVARELIKLSGLKPEVDIEIKVVGLRPGEKLFEELQHQGESFAPTSHSRITRFLSQPLNWQEMDDFLARIRELVHADRERCKLGIKGLVPEYVPYIE